ncbi:beta-glucan synthesis-associated protein [Serendipita vermifera]|nr:beta-glucan synthesis-associated protein [Serendipita vermifera]
MVRKGPINCSGSSEPEDGRARKTSDQSSILKKRFSLSPDPSSWGYDVSPKSYDPDDWLHKDEKDLNSRGSFCNSRGIPTIGCITLLALILVGLFLGYPIQDAIRHKIMSHNGGYNLGGINSTGQISESVFSLVDDDTPQEVRTKTSPVDGRTMRLVFSDEFNRDGRTFYPGDDPYWEAVDLHYWGTGDLEWYDPSMVYTKDGSLVLEVAEANPIDNHNMSYIGGMVTSWNKFCFTGGYIEASVQLPGSPTVNGFWPAVWTMGNLGRAGYGASTEGLWPYSYEACDIGTVPNQTENGFPPVQELQMGDQYSDYALSYLPGQRLSACTCPGEPHPGPVHRDGTFMARSSPEIDMIEAQIDSGLGGRGSASQSAQFAPFNGYYRWDNATYATYYMQPDEQHLNTYGGGVYQQAGSTVSLVNQECYQLPHSGGEGCYSIYGFQYKPGYAEDGAYITWVNDDKLSWRLEAAGFGPDATTGISARPVSKEPMYILANLGISQGFSGAIDFDLLTLPAYMKVDWIRVYQYEDDMNVGCDPPNYPTSNYINAYLEAYTNPNITTWSLPRNKGGLGEPWPKNSRVTPCD